jgi:hypothetical protein
MKKRRHIAGLRIRITLNRFRIRIHIFTLLRIRIWLFTLMRICIRILLLIKVTRICNHWSLVSRLSKAPFEPPRLHCEPPRLHFEPLKLLSFD